MLRNFELEQLVSKAAYLMQNINIQNNKLELEDTIVDISEFNDSSVIIPLLLLIRDSIDDDEIIFSIIHYVESFDDEVYVYSILSCLDELYNLAPYWCCVLMLRIINNDNSLQELKNQLKNRKSVDSSLALSIYENLLQKFPSASDKIKLSGLNNLN